MSSYLKEYKEGSFQLSIALFPQYLFHVLEWSLNLTSFSHRLIKLSTFVSGSETCDRAVRCYDEHVKFRGGSPGRHSRDGCLLVSNVTL